MSLVNSNKPKTIVMRDDDGEKVAHGDSIYFSYGIPPVGVTAKLEQVGSTLWALTPDHTPTRCKLRSLRRYVGSFYKA